MREELDTPADIEVARIAGRQHGVVNVAQLLAAGVDKSGVTRRVRTGRLHRVHRGVYAVGHRAPSHHSHWMAAVLAHGDGSVLSHTSAAALWGLLKPFRGPIHVSVPRSSGRSRRSGIVLHRSPSLAANPSLVTRRHRIPVTTPQRTIDDLRRTVAPYLLRRAIRQAELGGLRLDTVIASQTRKTRSDLELDFLRFCARHAIPEPEVNVRVGSWEVDFLWRPQRVAVETDFFDYHQGSVAFEDDHQRELDLRRLGFAVRRYIGRQLRDRPAEVAADLREALHLPEPA